MTFMIQEQTTTTDGGASLIGGKLFINYGPVV